MLHLKYIVIYIKDRYFVGRNPDEKDKENISIAYGGGYGAYRRTAERMCWNGAEP